MRKVEDLATMFNRPREKQYKNLMIEFGEFLDHPDLDSPSGEFFSQFQDTEMDAELLNF